MTRSRSFSLITLKISDCVATTGTRRGGMETAKLERLVSKLLREGAARKEDGVQPLMNVLLARHVEYQRKPQSVRARRPRPSAADASNICYSRSPCGNAGVVTTTNYQDR